MSEDNSAPADQMKLGAIGLLKWVIVPIAAIMLTEPLYRESMHLDSLDTIPQMQQVTKLKPFFTYVSMLGSGDFFSIAYIVVFNVMPKPAALYFWCVIAFSSFVLNQLKSTYHENRPYWEIPIDANKCETGFGNPSGHMLGNCFFWVTAYLHAYNEVGIIVPRMSVFCTAYIVKMALTAFGLVYLII